MTPKVLDNTTVQINYRDIFVHSKGEALKFIKFHKNIMQSIHEIGMYQYYLIKNARLSRQSKEIRTIDREIVYDYRVNIMLPILLPSNKQASKFNIDDALVEEELDYLCHSSRSVLSID